MLEYNSLWRLCLKKSILLHRRNIYEFGLLSLWVNKLKRSKNLVTHTHFLEFIELTESADLPTNVEEEIGLSLICPCLKTNKRCLINLTRKWKLIKGPLLCLNLPYQVPLPNSKTKKEVSPKVF